MATGKETDISASAAPLFMAPSTHCEGGKDGVILVEGDEEEGQHLVSSTVDGSSKKRLCPVSFMDERGDEMYDGFASRVPSYGLGCKCLTMLPFRFFGEKFERVPRLLVGEVVPSFVMLVLLMAVFTGHSR